MNSKKIFKSMAKPFLPVCVRAFFRSVSTYRSCFKRMPNLINPKTFNEKILFKMLFDRNPRLTLFADKFLVRDFVRSRLENGEQYLTHLYGVIDAPDKIDDLDLPNQFVMKPNHLSAQIKIVHDLNELERFDLMELAEKWLRRNYYYDDGYEWAYKNIKPRIMFEELLDFEGNIPDDYKFFCFNGKPEFIQIIRGRFTRLQRNVYDANFSLLPVKVGRENISEKIEAPRNFDKMLEIARSLSSGIDFIRVDLYNIAGRIVFGELTNYPNAATTKFDPSVWDLEFGKRWK